LAGARAARREEPDPIAELLRPRTWDDVGSSMSMIRSTSAPIPKALQI
jgi:hypothetical protein